MAKNITIGNCVIGSDKPCFIIAEIGGNHQGSLETCKEMFKVAKECGADAVKLQKRENRELYTKAMYEKPYENENSYGKTYGEHREFLEFGKEEYIELVNYAKELDIVFFATAFDKTSAEFLKELDMPAYKFASGEIRNIPLLKECAAYGKPILISTGGAAMEDIKRAYEAIMPINDQLVIFQCTAQYPAKIENMDLNVIKTFEREFPEAIIGLSSHDSGIAMPLAAYVLGARVIEKHFTLNRASKGTDHAFSLEPVGMKKLVRDIRRAETAMGDGEKHVYPDEITAREKQGKSLYFKHSIAKGQIITEDDITVKSPGGGLYPYEVDRVVGKTAMEDFKEEELVPIDKLK